MKKSEYANEYEHVMKVDASRKEKAYEFCEGYKTFIGNSKTERECVSTLISMAESDGYKPFDRNAEYRSGDKVYVNNREKALVLITFGKEKIDKGINFVISHIDVPRIDLKSNPVYESGEISYFKTHYYGGIKKYQWPTIPLSMHGRIFREDGTYIDICYGENDDEPKFVISDLLPHLAEFQMAKTMKEGVKAEDLNIIIGSIPLTDADEEIKDAVKENTLKMLYEIFKIKERDFARAEIEFVPAFKPSDIGFDRSMIAGYGQDDRVCAYPSYVAESQNVDPVKTSIAVFADKEEIGSEGNTGMISNFLFDVVEDIADMQGVKARDAYRSSICLSSDVNAAYDSTFADVFETKNASHINHGVIVTKFTGHAGKSGANDASAETTAKVIGLLEARNVIWQPAEFGKVDIGGGGTIAKYISQRNIDTIDLGVPVLSMHSPYEVVSKFDVYETYLAIQAFLLNK